MWACGCLFGHCVSGWWRASQAAHEVLAWPHAGCRTLNQMGPGAIFIPSWRPPSLHPPPPPSTVLPDRGSGPRVEAGCSLRWGWGRPVWETPRLSGWQHALRGGGHNWRFCLRSCPPPAPRLLHPNETARSLQCSPLCKRRTDPGPSAAHTHSSTDTHAHMCAHIYPRLCTEMPRLTLALTHACWHGVIHRTLINTDAQPHASPWAHAFLRQISEHTLKRAHTCTHTSRHARACCTHTPPAHTCEHGTHCSGTHAHTCSGTH